MDFQNIYVLSTILCFHVSNVMLSQDKAIKVEIKLKLKPSDPLPSKMNILFKKDGIFEDLWLIRNTEQDMNLPMYVIRNDHEGKSKLINIDQDENRESALYHNLMKQAVFLFKGKDNKPENFHLTGMIRMNKKMFELKKSNENGIRKSVKKRKMGSNVFLKITDFYTMELVRSNELKDDSILLPTAKLHENPKIKRVKRQAQDPPINFAYDMLMIIEYQHYLRGMKIVDPKNVLSNISRASETTMYLREFYLLAINCLNLIFKDIENFNYRIQVYLQSLIFLDTPESCEFIANTSGINGSLDVHDLFNNYQTWIADQNFPSYDHAMLIIDRDLYAYIDDVSVTMVTGISYVGALCTNYSISIVESRFGFAVTHVMIHELSHSLGCHHDGTYNNCTTNSNYIMSQQIEFMPKTTNPWYFSSCSLHDMKKNLDHVFEYGYSCAERISPHQVQNDSTLLPGQVYSADEQCQLAYGQESYFYRKENYTKDICKFIYCLKQEQGSKTASLTPLLTAPGTLCASQKWCDKGACVYSSLARNITLPCLFGDDPRLIGLLSCFQLVEQMPQICGMKNFRTRCSCSCSKYKVDDPCCPYGPETLECPANWCESFSGLCCQTCPISLNCSSIHSRKKRSNYFNAAVQKTATSFLKSYINLVTMKQNQPVVNNNDLEEKQIDLAKCPPMNTDMYEYCNKLVFAKSNGACYDELISQLCCQACILVMDKKLPGCKYGDRDEETCSKWAKEGQLANQCINNDQVREKICCQSCQLLAPTAFSGSKRTLTSFPCIMMASYAFLGVLRLIL